MCDFIYLLSSYQVAERSGGSLKIQTVVQPHGRLMIRQFSLSVN